MDLRADQGYGGHGVPLRSRGPMPRRDRHGRYRPQCETNLRRGGGEAWVARAKEEEVMFLHMSLMRIGF